MMRLGSAAPDMSDHHSSAAMATFHGIIPAVFTPFHELPSGEAGDVNIEAVGPYAD